MNALAPIVAIPSMSSESIAMARQVEAFSASQPQVKIPVHHFLHAGMYVRTVHVPEGVMITGALIKRCTVIVVSGDAIVYVGDECRRVQGHHVFAAGKNRKQIFIAKKDTAITMFFPTDAKTVKEAEEQFTDEAHLLQNREDC